MSNHIERLRRSRRSGADGWPRLAGLRLGLITVRPRRCAISTGFVALVDSWHEETAEVSAGRSRSTEAAVRCPSRATIAALQALAAATASSAIVEVGTGTGMTGLALLAGLTPGGVLTSIDSDAGRQRAAKDTLGAGGAGSGQVRLIAGAAHEVLPRLADGAYDLVVINDSAEYADRYYEQALRLLRPGGAVVFTDATGDGATFDASVDGPAVRSRRTMLEQAKDRELVHSCLLPVDGGLLIAVKR